jgi:ribose-phosphate pyrophosphokinase
VNIKRFADGECSVRIEENVRGKDVFLMQTCAAPVNDSIMELLLTLSAVRRAGAQRVTAVIPYFGYKHHRRGLPVRGTMDSKFLSSNAKDFAKVCPSRCYLSTGPNNPLLTQKPRILIPPSPQMLTELGVDRVISVDLQRPGQGGEACFFDNQVPLESLVTTTIMTSHISKYFQGRNNDLCVVAPNAECITKVYHQPHQPHSSPLITTHHHSSPPITTHHHSSPPITTHHHPSPARHANFRWQWKKRSPEETSVLPPTSTSTTSALVHATQRG